MARTPGGVTSTLEDTSTTTADKGLDDTFWSFTAPAGHSITSILVDTAGTTNSTTSQPVFDYIAIITSAGVTIPEPDRYRYPQAGLIFHGQPRPEAGGNPVYSSRLFPYIVGSLEAGPLAPSMKPLSLLPLTALASLATTAISEASVYVVSDGVYDPALQPNAVDTDATGTLSSFTTAVATAYTGGAGGVAHFDTASTGSGVGTLDFTFGAKSLRVTSSNSHVISGLGTATSSVHGISGPVGAPGTVGVGVLNTNGTGSNVTLNMGAITGGAVDEGVTSFGFTILSRNSYGASGTNFAATAFYSNGANSGAISSNIGATVATDDTFWSFTAPAGYAITSIAIAMTGTTSGNTGNTQPVFDDVAFITSTGVIVPEPSSILLAGAGLGLILKRRRKPASR